MKNKFKVGDKVKCISLKKFPNEVENWAERAKLKIGGMHTVCGVSEFSVQVSYGGYYISFKNFELYNGPKTLTIKKLTRKRAGKEYHTFQFSVKGKIVNHQFDTEQSRDKSLTRFIKYIQDGDFKIEKG